MPVVSSCRGLAAGTLAALAALPAHAQSPTSSNPPQVRLETPMEMPISATGIPVVQTTAGPVQGIRALTSDSATMTQTPLQQLPQSVQVVPRSLIDQQGLTTQSDAMLNVSGVQPLSTLMFGQLGPKIRGFQADRFVDGLPNYYDAGARDLLVNVERIEVLKGPSSLFYFGGTGQVGGVVNVISKMPTAQRFAEMGITIGGYRFISPYFDINQPLNKDGTVLFRMTAQFQGNGAYVQTLEQSSYTLNPTITFTNNDTTTLTLQGTLSQKRQQDYAGLPAVGTVNRTGFSVARNLFPSTAELPDSTTSIASITAKLDHRFNDTWSNSTIVRASQSRFDEPAQSILSNVPILPPSTFGTFNVLLKEDTSEIGLNSSMIARFSAGPTDNRFLIGVDYDTVWDEGFLDGQFAGLVDFASPVFPAYTVPPSGPFTTFTSIRNRYTQAGLAAQIQSNAWERLHVLAGARLANVNIRSNELTTGGAFTTDQTRLLPRLGVGFDIVPGLMLYGAYNQGLKAVPYFNGPVAPKAQSSEQFELGVKFETQIGLSGSIAAYQLTLDNVPVPSLTVPGTQTQSGQQQSRGIELDMIWQPTRAWSVLGSFAYAEAVVTKDTILPANTWLAQVPRYSGRLWANYTFQDGVAQGLSVGGGLYGASPQAVVVGGPWRTPGYVTFDARVAYPIKSWTLSLVARNLANKRYWVPYSYFDGRVAPGAGRTVYATAAVRF